VALGVDWPPLPDEAVVPPEVGVPVPAVLVVPPEAGVPVPAVLVVPPEVGIPVPAVLVVPLGVRVPVPEPDAELPPPPPQATSCNTVTTAINVLTIGPLMDEHILS
jgi:hypothetical protein